MYRIRFIFLALNCLVGLSDALGQSSYFQQELEYVIDAKLDDRNQVLSGTVHLSYKNNAPVPLKELYFHYYVNAYKNQDSEYAKQKLRNRETDYYFAKPEQLGYYKSPKITLDGDTLKSAFLQEYEDVLRVELKKPILPTETIELIIPFSFKIPFLFSRSGHVDQNYQFAQWYPKPAVYDSKGWHLVPYLEFGEFYGEFAKFTVNLTLPRAYVVASTGALVTEEERVFLDSIATITQNAIDSNIWDRPLDKYADWEMKTIQFKAANVHDFAWAADKKYYLLKSQVPVGGRTVSTSVYFHGSQAKYWVPTIHYLNRAISSYSEWVGHYPYPQATVVQSLKENDGGMEYPMLTFISPMKDSSGLEMVITHEVGHNWFYGILGSNERDHAWMDEGINTYYENRYRKQFHPADEDQVFTHKWLTRNEPISLFAAFNRWNNLMGQSMPVDSKSGDEHTFNYLLNAYFIPGNAFDLLEKKMGRAELDKAMQRYFNTWKFRHPYPEDFQAVLEQYGKENLSWLFSDWFVKNEKSQYSIVGIKKENDQPDRLILKNKGKLSAPVDLAFYKEGKLSSQIVLAGFKGKYLQKLPAISFDSIRLDPEHLLPQIDHLHTMLSQNDKGNWKSDPGIRLRFGIGLGSPSYRSIYVLPSVAYNKYDGFQLGAFIHNIDFPGYKFSYMLSPMFGFNSKTLTGIGQIAYNIYPNARSNAQLQLGLDARRFTYFTQETFDYTLAYNRISPKIGYTFKHTDISDWRFRVNYQPVFINKNSVNFEFIDSVLTAMPGEDQQFLIHRVNTTFSKSSIITPFRGKIELEQQNYKDIAGNDAHYLKLNLSLESSYKYAPKKDIEMRFFAGFFLENSQKDAQNFNDGFVQGSYSLFGRGKDDYAFDRLYIGRSESKGIWSAQISPDIQGGFHQAVSPSFSDGQSNRYLVSVNLKGDLPQLPSYLPIKPYFDAAVLGVDLADGGKQDFFWVGGVMLEVFNGLASIHIPIIKSKQFNYLDSQTRGGKFLSNISFQLALQNLNLIKLRNEIPKYIF